MKMRSAFVLLTLVGSIAGQGNWVDEVIPSLHNASEYPEVMRRWEQLKPVFDTMHRNHNLSIYSFPKDGNGLPLLPCISFPKLVMEDGTKIFTIVVNPWPCRKKKGAVLARSPYGPTTQNIALVFTVLNGFAAVMQDQRGTMSSGGTFDLFRNDGQDGHCAINWIKNQTWSNGDVYTAGISADGIATMTPSIHPGATMKGQWAMWTTSNGHEFVYPQGLYRQDLMHGYLNLITLLGEGRKKTADMEAEIWKAENFGPWWYNLTDTVNLSEPTKAPGDAFKNIHWPVVFSVGWWDIFQGVALRAMEGIWTDGIGDPAVRDKHVAIIDPLGHCMIGNTGGFAEGENLYGAAVNGIVVAAELASDMWAGRDRVRSRIGRLNFYLMRDFAGDAPRNTPGRYWVSLPDWPNFTALGFYLQPGGVSSDSPPSRASSIDYTYDPSTKDGLTPMLGGNNLPIVGKISHCGSTDLRARDKRDDVLVFDSGELTSDLIIVGRIRAKLFVSSTAKDTDFVVTVEDLSKTKSMLVRYGAVRMRWRNGGTGDFLKPAEPLVNGTVYEVDVDLLHTAYVFAKGHRVRVSISSAAYPYYDANPNTHSPEIQKIPPSRFEPVSARNAIHVGPEFPTHVSLPVVKLADVPHNKKFAPTFPPIHAAASEMSLIV